MLILSKVSLFYVLSNVLYFDAFLRTFRNMFHILNLRKRRDDTSPRPKGDTKLNQQQRHPPPSGAEVIR